MTRFEKVNNAFSKCTRFLLSHKRPLIVFLALLIIWTWLFCAKPGDQSNVATKRIPITCNDSTINHPMASQSQSFRKEILIYIEKGLFCYMFMLLAALKGSFISRDTNLGDNISLVEFVCRYVLWSSVFLTGSLFVWLWVAVPTETLAPNFLAACKPLELDLLCSSGCYFDGAPVVGVTCTTPAKVWIPALSNSLPPFSAIHAFTMFTLLFYVIFNWKRKFNLKSAIVGGLVASIALIVSVGYSVIACNEANFGSDFLLGYLKSCIVACWLIVVDSFFLDERRNQSELPLNWNDILQRAIVPQTGQLPPNLTPLGHEPRPPKTGSSPGDEDNVNSPPYPNLPPKYECPPSYTDAVPVA